MSKASTLETVEKTYAVPWYEGTHLTGLVMEEYFLEYEVLLPAGLEVHEY